MPLVIDANAASALAAGECKSSQAILRWARTKGEIVSGGKLQQELSRTALKTLLVQWRAAGRLRILSAQDLDEEEARVSPLARSNDSHVLAVAIVGAAQVVVTGDNSLKQDLKDVQIVQFKRKIISCNQGVLSEYRIVRSLLNQQS
jgi:predicted nucleic acid-binding protein